MRHMRGSTTWRKMDQVFSLEERLEAHYYDLQWIGNIVSRIACKESFGQGLQH